MPLSTASPWQQEASAGVKSPFGQGSLVLCPVISVSELPELGQVLAVLFAHLGCPPAKAQLVLQQAPSSSQVCKLFYCVSQFFGTQFLGFHTFPCVTHSQVCCVPQPGFTVFGYQQESILWFVPRAASLTGKPKISVLHESK